MGRSQYQAKAFLIAMNLLVKAVPTSPAEAMIAIEISEATKPYSMAVAPSSSAQNVLKD
jgi:hypothetical protein